METIQLPYEESIATGFTHKAIIAALSLFPQPSGSPTPLPGDFTAAALTQAYTLFTPGPGQIIDRVARYTRQELAGPGVTAATVSVGDGSSAIGFLTAQSVLSGAAPVDTQAGDGAYLNQAGGKAYNAADALVATLTNTGANVNALTQGIIEIFFSVKNLALH